jgi:hypothetical protein
MGLTMIQRLVEEGLGFGVYNTAGKILDFAHKEYLCFGSIAFFVSFKNFDCLLVSKTIGKVMGLMMIQRLVEEGLQGYR